MFPTTEFSSKSFVQRLVIFSPWCLWTHHPGPTMRKGLSVHEAQMQQVLVQSYITFILRALALEAPEASKHLSVCSTPQLCLEAPILTSRWETWRWDCKTHCSSRSNLTQEGTQAPCGKRQPPRQISVSGTNLRNFGNNLVNRSTVIFKLISYA